MKWQATAPSNIALIKYMGKSNGELNLPSNASLSYTLNNLISTVELELTTDQKDIWQPFSDSETTLSEKEQTRFINHLNFLKVLFKIDHHFIIRSKNNFPAGCGLASSASSFAALTKCAANAFKELNSETFNHLEISTQTFSSLSRRGSGSSCRSFYSPWALWRDDKADAIALPYSELIHHTIVVSHQKKLISSSAAHYQVTTSSLFHGRAERAEQRLNQLMQCFIQKDWQNAFVICWQEFWDMHALFETCATPFGYLTPESLAVLNYLRDYWKVNQDGPLVTMDAGPNVHLLFRPEQTTMINQILTELSTRYSVI